VAFTSNRWLAAFERSNGSIAMGAFSYSEQAHLVFFLDTARWYLCATADSVVKMPVRPLF
jgi:hypothetical protein